MKKLVTKIYLVLLAASCIFIGCKKMEQPQVEESNNGEFIKKNNGKNLKSGGDGVWDLLGYGYDITGEFANSSASRFSVIDIVRLKADYFARVESDVTTKQDGVLIAGENAESYLEKVTARVNIGTLTSVKKFKATIDATYLDSDAFSSKYVYSSYSHKIQQKRVKVNATNAMLMDYLRPEFINDVQNGSAQYIISSYGTHVLSDIILGAKLEALYRSETTKTDRINASTSGLTFSLGTIFNINTGHTYDFNSTLQNFSQTLKYKTVGGNPSISLLGTMPLGSSSLPTFSIAAWQASSTVSNAAMIDIGENGLIPIWDLISDPVKSAQVKAYAEQYISDSEAQIIQEPVPNYFENEGRLFRTTSDEKVYSIMDGIARHIGTYATLSGVYNYSGSNIQNITNLSAIANPIGALLGSNTHLLRNANDNKLYFAEGNYIRYITSPAAASKYRLKISNNSNIGVVYGIGNYIVGPDLY